MNSSVVASPTISSRALSEELAIQQKVIFCGNITAVEFIAVIMALLKIPSLVSTDVDSILVDENPYFNLSLLGATKVEEATVTI